MRIIAGEHRGRPLKTPKGDGTRPTTDRVRESLMSMVASARGGFEGARVLDAFAGSGALGLEALSRGASYALFCEKAPQAVSIVRDNIALLSYGANQAAVRKGDVFKAVLTPQQPFDLVFCDPPYAYAPSDVVQWLDSLAGSGLLEPDALISYEHDEKDSAALEEALVDTSFVIERHREFGLIAIDLLRWSPGSVCQLSD